MEEMMTVPEIEQRYRDERVLLENPQTDKQLNVLAGKVLWHSKERDEIYEKAIELRPKHSAFLYMGDFYTLSPFAILPNVDSHCLQ